jgi:hypothetical protein
MVAAGDGLAARRGKGVGYRYGEEDEGGEEEVGERQRSHRACEWETDAETLDCW